MAWLGIVALLALLTFAMGLSALPKWTLGVLPTLGLAVGVMGTVNEPPNYDMHGFALYVYGGLGVICLLASVVGRWVRLVFFARAERPPRGRA